MVFFLAMPLLIKFSVSLQQVGVSGEPTIKLLPKVDEYLSLADLSTRLLALSLPATR